MWRTNKYRAKPCEVNGQRCASGGEGLRYKLLLLLEKAGEIQDLKFQSPVIRLTLAEITYRPDYTYWEKGQFIVEDFKGVMTDRFKLVMKLYPFYGVGTLRVTQRAGNGFRVAKEIRANNAAATTSSNVRVQAASEADAIPRD